MHITVMSISLVLLTFFALIAAIGVISRMQKQFGMKSSSRQVVSATQFGVRDVTSPASEKPQLQPDIDSTQAPATTTSKDALETPIDLSVIPPFMPQPELEIPLATSLKVSDVVHPTGGEPEIDLHHQISTESQNEAHSSVIEEVIQLEQSNEWFDRLTHQAQDADSTMRVAVAAQLGELAVQGHNREQVIALLNHLSQDVDPQVRVQATASMGMIPPDLPNTIA